MSCALHYTQMRIIMCRRLKTNRIQTKNIHPDYKKIIQLKQLEN